MLLIDGVEYELWTPPSEDDLERIVIEHAEEIFGKDCLHFEKQKLKAASVAAISDALVISFNPDRWWIVEVELSTHDVYTHIQNQVGRFIAALPHATTRQQVRNALWRDIDEDKWKELTLEQHLKGVNSHKWLTDLIEQPPKLAIVIDKRVPGLDDAKDALKIQPEVVEFLTFVRERVGLAVHAHLFEPLVKEEKPVLAVTPQPVTPFPTPQPIAPVRPVTPPLGNRIEVILTEGKLGKMSWKKYAVIYLHREQYSFFPGYRVAFQMETDIGNITTWRGQGSGKAKVGDPGAGVLIGANMKPWFDAHPELKPGVKLVIEAIEPYKRYRLSIIHS